MAELLYVSMVLVLLHAYNRATGYTCRSYPVAEQEGLEHLAEEGGVLVDGLLDDDVAVADRQAAAVLQVQQRRLEVLQQRYEWWRRRRQSLACCQWLLKF